MGHACVMGRRTWLSLKRPLKERLNIVLSRSADTGVRDEQQEGVVVLADKCFVLALTPYLSCDLYVIGGEQVYRAFENEIERWIVTEIPLSVEGADTFMPRDFLRDFKPQRSLSLADELKVTIYERH